MPAHEEFGDGQSGDRLIAAQWDRPSADIPPAVWAAGSVGERHAVVVQDHPVAGDGEHHRPPSDPAADWPWSVEAGQSVVGPEGRRCLSGLLSSPVVPTARGGHVRRRSRCRWAGCHQGHGGPVPTARHAPANQHLLVCGSPCPARAGGPAATLPRALVLDWWKRPVPSGAAASACPGRCWPSCGEPGESAVRKTP